MSTELQIRTTAALGQKWKYFTITHEPCDSVDKLHDTFGCLLSPDDYRDQRVAEIGAGTGRFSRTLLAAGVKHLVAVEPSDAFPALVANLYDERYRVDCLNCTGDRLPPTSNLDYVFAVGMLHHQPDPRPIVHAAFQALRPEGRMVVSVYSQEGWQVLRPLVQMTRAAGRHLPSPVQWALAWCLCALLSLYVALCRFMPLPLRKCAREVMAPLRLGKRHEVICNQLNAAYTKHYNKMEAQLLLAEAGFCEIEMHRCHGYCWSAMGTKPAD